MTSVMLTLGLQVEHGITEMVNRVDLVAWQLKLQCPGFKVLAIACTVYCTVCFIVLFSTVDLKLVDLVSLIS